MAKFVCLEEYQLDYFSNKKGRTTNKGTCGDKLTAKECLTITVKKPLKTKVTQLKKPKVNLLKVLNKCGYKHTGFINSAGLKMQLEINRILYPNQIKRMVQDVKGYFYIDPISKKESEPFFL